MSKQKIIIIGGGIGGLMTSIALNKKGIENILFEQTNSFKSAGAGLALWANATGILDKFGILSKLLPYSNILNELRTSTWNGKQLNVVHLKKLEEKFYFPSIVLLRSNLQEVLAGTILTSQIKFNKQCVSIEKNQGTSIVHFADGTTEAGDAIILADGIHSLAGKNIFNLSPLKYAGRTSWRGIAQFDKPVFDTISNYEIFGKGKRIGIFPLPGNLAYWYAAVNMNIHDAGQQERTLQGVLSHFKGWAEPVNTLIKNTSQERLILTKIFYAPDINKIVNNNIALLGDAAHPMTPDLGQGACQAIEDAYVLAECLSQNKTIEVNLKNYEIKRLPRVKKITLNSYRMGWIRQVGNPPGVTFRNILFKFLPGRFALRVLAQNIKSEN